MSDVFPTNEDRITDFLPYSTVNGVTRFRASGDMLNGVVTLDAILECHDKEVLVVTLTVGIHDWVMPTVADSAG